MRYVYEGKYCIGKVICKLFQAHYGLALVKDVCAPYKVSVLYTWPVSVINMLIYPIYSTRHRYRVFD